MTDRITALETRRDNLESQIIAIENGDVESYKFESGEGSQQTKYRPLSELDKSLTRLNAQLDRLYRISDGKGLVVMNLRRKC